MFEVRDLVELEVLQKALMVARFSGEDPVLLGSPYISVLHTMIVDELIARNRAEGRQGAAADWEKWRTFSKDRREWNHVRRELSRTWHRLPALDTAEKADYVRSCLAPFEVSAELVDEMVRLLDEPTSGSHLAEQEDRWILPLAGLRVDQCLVDFAFTLRCEGGFEVRIECPFRFRAATGETRELDPDEDPADLAVALRIVRGSVRSAVALKGGQLEVEFVDGSAISVPADASFEAWNLVGPEGMRVICLPGGELAIWS